MKGMNMMNRELFMRDLARFLSDLPAEEREQALNYYEDYFEDAGPENEQKVIEELGSPVDVAKQIKSVNREQISYGEGSAQKNIAAPKVILEKDSSNAGGQNNANCHQGSFQNNNWGNQSNFQNNGYGNPGSFSENAGQTAQKGSWTQNPVKMTLVIILAILAIPVGIPLVSALFGVAIALFACLFSLFVSFFAVGSALVFSGGAGIVCTIFALAGGHYASSILALGFSLILIAVGLFMLWLGIVFCCKGIPAVWKAVVFCCRSIGKGIKHFFS